MGTHQTVVLITWGTIVLELCLMCGLFMAKKHRKWLLLAGLSLHGAIAVFQGLVSFFFSMAAVLILYLRPFDYTFDFTRVISVARCAVDLAKPKPRPSQPLTHRGSRVRRRAKQSVSAAKTIAIPKDGLPDVVVASFASFPAT